MSVSKRNKQLLILITISCLVLLLWYIPALGIVRYPFMLLGTWFHEMGHGLTSIAVGAHFDRLEIFANGSGIAYTTYYSDAWVPIHIGRALVAAGGLLGPAIAGGILVILSSKPNSARWGMRFLLVVMITSILLYVRSTTGVWVLLIISILLGLVSFVKNKKLTQLTLLFLGIQSTLSTYLQLDYLFTGEFVMEGKLMKSDTQNIAESLSGSYWMWGVVIIIISAFILWRSYRYYLIHSE